MEILTTFRIGASWFALDAMLVQEVIMVVPLTPVHNAPAYVSGLINLRGKIVTVLDLARKIGLGALTVAPTNRILIIPQEDDQIGMLVEEVGEMAYPEPGQIKPPPSNVPGDQLAFFKGVWRQHGQVVTLLDPVATLAVQTSHK